MSDHPRKITAPNWYCRCHCCGRHFTSIRETVYHCSPKCRQRASRKNRGLSNTWGDDYFRDEYQEPARIFVAQVHDKILAAEQVSGQWDK